VAAQGGEVAARNKEMAARDKEPAARVSELTRQSKVLREWDKLMGGSMIMSMHRTRDNSGRPCEVPARRKEISERAKEPAHRRRVLWECKKKISVLRIHGSTPFEEHPQHCSIHTLASSQRR
jgi:hypothetical protein